MPEIKLYNADCLDILKDMPNKSVDLVLTDPPYNIGYTYEQYDDNLTEESYIELLSEFQYPYKTVMIHYPEEMMKYLCPALGNPDEIMAWCYNSNLPRQFRLIGFWNCSPDKTKVLQPYKNPKDKRILQTTKNGSKGAKIYDWFSDIQYVKNVSKEKTIHPCPVPVELMKRIILMTTKPDDIVLDPFMGSGTTGVACKLLNRSFIGIEIDKKYFELAKRRIDNTEWGLFK